MQIGGSVLVQGDTLVHPRQAGKLGLHNEEWHKLHQEWIEKKAPAISVWIKAGV